jgi:hypothetical protein
LPQQISKIGKELLSTSGKPRAAGLGMQPFEHFKTALRMIA